VAGRATRTPTRAEPLNRPPRRDADDLHRHARWTECAARRRLHQRCGPEAERKGDRSGCPNAWAARITTQRSEQYLEARTGRGARAEGPPAGVGAKMRQPTGDRLRTLRMRERCNESDGARQRGDGRCVALAPKRSEGVDCTGCPSGGAGNNTGSPAAFERIHVTDGAASLTNSYRFERVGSARRRVSGVQATGHERRKELAMVGARQGHRCRERSLRRERSWRMVVLGRRIARGGRECGNLSRLRPQRMDGSRNRSGSAGVMNPNARARNSRPQPASGRCGVSPLEWGGRDADSNAGKGISPG
jgi:hypothetical protein